MAVVSTRHVKTFGDKCQPVQASLAAFDSSTSFLSPSQACRDTAADLCLCRGWVTSWTSGRRISGPHRGTNLHSDSWTPWTCELHSERPRKCTQHLLTVSREDEPLHSQPKNFFFFKYTEEVTLTSNTIHGWRLKKTFYATCMRGIFYIDTLDEIERGRKKKKNLKEPINKMLILAGSRNHPSK